MRRYNYLLLCLISTLLFVQFPANVHAEIRVLDYPELKEIELELNSTLTIGFVAVLTQSARSSATFMITFTGNWSLLGFSALLSNLNLTNQFSSKIVNNTITIYNKEIRPPTGKLSLKIKLKPLEAGSYNVSWSYTIITLSSRTTKKIPIPKIERNKGVIAVHVKGEIAGGETTTKTKESLEKSSEPKLEIKESSGKTIVISDVEAPSKVLTSELYLIEVTVSNLSNKKDRIFVAVINELTGELLASCQVPVNPREGVKVVFGIRAPSIKGVVKLRVISGREGIEEDFRSLNIEVI